MKVIDGTDLSLGRLASHVAKAALKSEEEISIVNAEKVLVQGPNKASILEVYKEKHRLGDRYQGPFFPKRPDRIVKRTVRGMLPYKKPTGRSAFDRVQAFVGVPEELAKETPEIIEKAKINFNNVKKTLQLGEISTALGSKWQNE